MAGYLDTFLGATCWRCGGGHIGLLDKGLGAHLVCSSYPKSCQFISVSPLECPKCAQGSLVIEHHDNKRYLCHCSCDFKSPINDLELKLGKSTKEESEEIQKIRAQGLLVDYLSTLSLDQLNEHWESKAWEDPVSFPISENIEEEFIKESVRKIRSIKWKLANKSNPSISGG
jgi:ribosomal protein S27AE